MERKNSITLSSITNFLDTGALLRHRDQWVLIEGPFSPSSDANSDEITVFFPDFYKLSTSSTYVGTKTHVLTDQDLRDFCEAALDHFGNFDEKLLSDRLWNEPSKVDFREAMRNIQDRIFKGEIQKAVPVIFARSSQTVTKRERAQMILNLIAAPTTLYVYGFWQDGEGVLGATPETLFEFHDGLLTTMALAGTCPKEGSADRQSLLRDPKELQEHELVVDDIRHVLKRYGDVQSRGPEIVELPSLFHLKTHFEVHCSQQPEFMSLIQAMHPTPALGVAPRNYGYHWMQELPGQEGRAGFGAPFAFISKAQAICLVSIRNLQWNHCGAMIGSGCGIVAVSEFEREWNELFQKRLSVKRILGLEK